MTDTLIQAVWALRTETRRGVTFLDTRGRRRRVPHSDLCDAALRVAGSLRRRGLTEGDPVVLVLADPREAIVSILGAMMAGCPPVPIYPPTDLGALPSTLTYLADVARRSRARHVVALPSLLPFLATSQLRAHRFAALLDGPTADPAAMGPSDTALLQFTSGSTAAPKGVIVTHEALATNIAMIRSASRMDADSVVTTWLPVYHDMGLIGTVLNAVSAANDLVVMSPMTFVRWPRLWLDLITEFRGTHSAAPNFAYGLCTRRVPDLRGLDLSSMRTFICGAEPIVPDTLERFAAHFETAGLNANALTPAYGLAEATLAVTFTPHLRGMRCDEDVEPRVASCGRPLEGIDLRISNGHGESFGERSVGEVQLRGPTITPGYVRDPAATRAAFSPDGWLRTGDLGYLSGGELFLCGRDKDVLIVRGRNFYAHDLEANVGEVLGVRKGSVVATAATGADRERIVIIAESRTPEDGSRIARDVRAILRQNLRIIPDDVRIVPPGTIPKTSSGKLKRGATRELYERGTLEVRRGTLETWGAVVRAGLGVARMRAHTPPPGS